MAAWGPYVWEWGSILLRWLHVTAAIAWIGASFFFMHLDAWLAQNAGHEDGRRRRLVAGAWRRLLRDEQIHARPGRSCPITSSGTSGSPIGPGSPASACCAGSITADRASSSSIRRWAARAVAGGGDRRRVAGARLDRLRPHVQVAAGQARRAAGAGRLRLRRADELRLLAGLLGPRRADPHRRADGDDDDRQCLPGHHAQPAQVGGGADRRARARAAMGEDLQAAFDPQQLHHAARPVHDAVEPLSGDLRQRAAIPAIVTCVVIAGALIRYFYNRWHADETRKAPWWAWLAAAAAIWAAFWVAMASSPGMRPELGLAPAAEPTLAAGLDLPRAPQAVVDVVQTRCACATRRSRSGTGSALRRKA